jgi:hypothetical protein
MDLRTKDGYGTKQPRGGATTLLDLVTRDDQDTSLFPLTANITRFIRDEGMRTVPMTSVYQEFTFRGPAEFGQTFTFELAHTACGDLINGLFIQIRLADWIPAFDRERLRCGQYTVDSNVGPKWWTYINSLGTALLNEATLEVDDQVLERITGDACTVISTLFPDLNTQIGLSETIARQSISDLKAMDGSVSLPTDDMWITVPLCFSMLRERLTATFPLIACRDGTMRVRLSLKPFDQIVRSVTGIKACDDTPLGKTFNYFDARFREVGPIRKTLESFPNVPKMRQIQLLTYGTFVDGPYREMLLRQPFERPFREIQQFDFNEPLKFVVNKTGDDRITIQLPLEANQPVEEIVWFLRRKAAVKQNNDWINFSATLEKDYHPVFGPLEPLLIGAKIQGNGMEIVSQDEAWFRSHISRAHRGGKVAYDSFIYGYSFAKTPGEHDPTGSINASRLSSLRLVLDVKPPLPTTTADTEWEVHVFVFAFQWLRFGNGLCNKVFID